MGFLQECRVNVVYGRSGVLPECSGHGFEWWKRVLAGLLECRVNAGLSRFLW